MQNIDSDLIRGNIDTIILKTMLDEDKYGLDIIKEVSDKSSGTYELKQPTLYSCLKRLENQALISSYWVDSEIGGKRHYYKLTDKGREFYNKKQEEWARSKFIIDNLLSNYNYEEYRLVKKDEYGEILERQANAPLYANTSSEIKENQDESKDELPDIKDVNEETEETYSNEESYDSESANKVESEYYGDSDEEDEQLDDEDYSEESLSKLEQFLSNPENPNNDDVFEFSEAESNEDFEDEEFSYENNTSDDDYPVYFEAKPQNNNDKQINVSYETSDQSSNELNILSRLRDQENENINTYYGDQKSYVNHLRNLDESQVEQQDLLDSSLYALPDEVNKSIDEFSNAIDKLNNFDSSTSSDEDNNEEFSENFEDETIVEPSPSDDDAVKDDYDELNELESIKNISSNKFFNSEDTVAYDKLQPQKNTNKDFDNFEFEYNPEEKTSMSFEEIANEIKPLNHETLNNENYYSEAYNELEDDGFAIDTPDSYGESEMQNKQTDDNMSQIDSIISKNVTAQYTEPTPSFYTSNTNNYREKLSNLSRYSRVSLDDEQNTKDNSDAIEKAKDISEITKELEAEGIKIREHYTQSNSKKLDRNYLLSNKINLVKSLILLFGYVFILSATYIILNNTALAKNSWFSITPFLIGFIPFGIYTLYYLILFAVNPYKKIDAKFHFRIMLFISVIVTIQLLLITYCINLQLGFYSFAQKEYNHLYWIIPGIISFAPIIDNFIYLALFKSRNFNV